MPGNISCTLRFLLYIVDDLTGTSLEAFLYQEPACGSERSNGGCPTNANVTSTRG